MLKSPPGDHRRGGQARGDHAREGHFAAASLAVAVKRLTAIAEALRELKRLTAMRFVDELVRKDKRSSTTPVIYDLTVEKIGKT